MTPAVPDDIVTPSSQWRSPFTTGRPRGVHGNSSARVRRGSSKRLQVARRRSEPYLKTRPSASDKRSTLGIMGFPRAGETFLTLLQASVASRRTTGPAVWDRLWRQRPPDARDATLIARERRSPRWRTIVAKLEAWFGTLAGLRTIELGSGRGDLSALLGQRGARVTLLDTSDRALAQARHRFDRMRLKAEFVQADMLGALDRVREPFDVALSSGVIEHFTSQDRTRAVRAHYDVLRRGGATIISVPHAWCLPYRMWKSYLELRGWWPYGMELPYSTRELSRRAFGAGINPHRQ